MPRLLASRSGRNIADDFVIVGSHSRDGVAVADAVGRCSCTSTKVSCEDEKRHKRRGKSSSSGRERARAGMSPHPAFMELLSP